MADVFILHYFETRSCLLVAMGLNIGVEEVQPVKCEN